MHVSHYKLIYRNVNDVTKRVRLTLIRFHAVEMLMRKSRNFAELNFKTCYSHAVQRSTEPLHSITGFITELCNFARHLRKRAISRFHLQLFYYCTNYYYCVTKNIFRNLLHMYVIRVHKVQNAAQWRVKIKGRLSVSF